MYVCPYVILPVLALHFIVLILLCFVVLFLFSVFLLHWVQHFWEKPLVQSDNCAIMNIRPTQTMTVATPAAAAADYCVRFSRLLRG